MIEPDDLDKFEEWKQDQMDDYWAYEKYLKGFFKKQGIKLDDWEEYLYAHWLEYIADETDYTCEMYEDKLRGI